VTLGIYSQVIGDSQRRAVENLAGILDYLGLQTTPETESIQSLRWSGRWEWTQSVFGV